MLEQWDHGHLHRAGLYYITELFQNCSNSMTDISAEVITQSESRPEVTLEVEMSDPWPSLVIMDGNVSPSSDSGLGSEDEQLSHVYENLRVAEAEAGGVRTLYDLTQALTIDTELTTVTTPEIRGVSDTSLRRQGSSCEREAGENLSLLLTSQNPSRIDVMSLKRSKVSHLNRKILTTSRQLSHCCIISELNSNYVSHSQINVICVFVCSSRFIVVFTFYH